MLLGLVFKIGYFFAGKLIYNDNDDHKFAVARVQVKDQVTKEVMQILKMYVMLAYTVLNFFSWFSFG